MQITRELLLDLLTAAKHAWPNETFALLSSSKNNGLLDEFVVVPAVGSEDSVVYDLWHLPLDPKIKGSFHSHPTADRRASDDDRESFIRSGSVHIIAGTPYGENDWTAYDANGKKTTLVVVDP